MVEQVGHNHELGRLALFEVVVGDGSGEMSLATTVNAHKNQPAVGRFGEFEGKTKCFFQVLALLWQWIKPFPFKTVEGHVLQQPGFEPAVFPQAALALFFPFLLRTATGHGSAVVGLTRRQKGVNEPRPLAERAG
ncbi:hypothetical protein ES703_08425 [subsurface metagenome]